MKLQSFPNRALSPQKKYIYTVCAFITNLMILVLGDANKEYSVPLCYSQQRPSISDGVQTVLKIHYTVRVAEQSWQSTATLLPLLPSVNSFCDLTLSVSYPSAAEHNGTHLLYLKFKLWPYFIHSTPNKFREKCIKYAQLTSRV